MDTVPLLNACTIHPHPYHARQIYLILSNFMLSQLLHDGNFGMLY